jgi:hypothetical protein
LPEVTADSLATRRTCRKMLWNDAIKYNTVLVYY